MVATSQRIHIIAAMTPERVIGMNGTIPWKIPSDMKRFREQTGRSPLIMGWNTFNSIINKHGTPLQGRKHIVLTRNHRGEVARCWGHPASSVEQALALARKKNVPDVFVIGGESVYTLFMPIAHALHITTVHGHVIGDTYFPLPNWNEWAQEGGGTVREQGDEYTTTYKTYRRR